jgi:hypothetical protein
MGRVATVQNMDRLRLLRCDIPHGAKVRSCNRGRSELFSLRGLGEDAGRMARSPVTQADCSLAGVTIFAGPPKEGGDRAPQTAQAILDRINTLSSASGERCPDLELSKNASHQKRWRGASRNPIRQGAGSVARYKHRRLHPLHLDLAGD